jgi:hypothetical protein
MNDMIAMHVFVVVVDCVVDCDGIVSHRIASYGLGFNLDSIWISDSRGSDRLLLGDETKVELRIESNEIESNKIGSNGMEWNRMNEWMDCGKNRTEQNGTEQKIF